MERSMKKIDTHESASGSANTCHLVAMLRWCPCMLEKYISSVNLLLNFLSYQNSGEKIRYIFVT
jgi:hypothetical protein